jgi:hypothetical protein
MCLLPGREVHRLIMYFPSHPIAVWLDLFDTGMNGEGPEGTC